MSDESQKTLAAQVEFSGVGLHTGEPVQVQLKPAPPNSGVTFIRTDVTPEKRIPLALENLRNNPRRSTLGVDSVEVHTVEHLLAVLNVLNVHNLDIYVDGPELPGMDGSALEFLDGVLGAGIESQGVRAPCLEVRDPVAVQSDAASIVALPSDGSMRVSYTLHYEGPPRLTQHCSMEINEETFRKEIAPARTFVLENEVKELQARGLGLGANTQNTLVIGEQGVIDYELRFPDEYVRHKILDLLGDMFILGSRLQGATSLPIGRGTF